MNIIIGIAALLVLVIILMIFRVLTLLSVARGSDKKRAGLSNKINALLFPIFLVGGTALFLWYSFGVDYHLPLASIHGGVTDNLFWLTTGIISFVFVLTHVFLFWFPFKYQYKEGRKAHFYPDNHKLEIVWTVIPAIVLTVLVFTGLKAWTDITEEAPQDAEVVELLGYQFAWKSRYPGKDGQLGPYDFRLIDNVNEWGLDFTKRETLDDFTPGDRIVRIPKGKPVLFVIRARDVLHSLYVPHMRVKMDAVPGMPTKFWFTATKTTKEMRDELKKENKPNADNFNYEIACAEVCGRGHFSMRLLLEVLEEKEYNEWKATQQSWLSKNPDYLSKVPEKLKDLAVVEVTPDNILNKKN